MTQEDEINFLDAVRCLGPLKVIYNTFAEVSEMEAQLLQPVGTTASDANLSLLSESVDTKIEHEFFPGPGVHCVNLSESDVVQFNRCKPNGEWLGGGRLWFDERTSLGVKSADFLNWANSLLKWIRTNYHIGTGGFRIGPHALELSNAGKIQLGPPIEPKFFAR